MPIPRTFNKDFFKRWSSEMAYILGFLFADGNIIKTKRNTHFVGIYTKDCTLLESIRKILNSDHKISLKKGNCYALQIGSKVMYDDLVKLGLTPNKSRRMQFPQIPEKYVNDFIRGYFDGDGCVWVGDVHTKRQKSGRGILVIFTSAPHHFLSYIRDLLVDLGVRNGSLYRSNKGNYSRLSFSVLDSLKIYEIMYNSSTTLFLSRKKVVFEGFICGRSSIG